MGDEREGPYGAGEAEAGSWRESWGGRATRALQPSMQAGQLAVSTCLAEALAGDGCFVAALRGCLGACRGIAGIEGAAIYLVDGAPGELVLECQEGFHCAALEGADGAPGLLGEVRARTTLLAIPSPAVDAAAGERFCGALGVDAALLLPLVWAGRVEGVLVLGGLGQRLLDDDTVAFARTVAAQLAQALVFTRTVRRLAGVEARYRAVLAHAHDAICLVDDAGVVVESNRGLELLLGRCTADVLGRSIHDFAAPGHAEANRSAFRAALHEPGHGGADIRFAAADGTIKVVSFTGSIIELDGRHTVVATGRDVTEQKQAQAQLMVSDRMASVGMLAAGVAHEINNPLAAVLANLEMAVRDAADLATSPTAAAELVEEVHDAREGADRVRQIVRDLKIFSRAEDEAQGPIDLHRVLDSAARMAWNELRHRAHVVKHYGCIAAIVGNEARLGQVFLNLIVNAAQAIPEGHADENQVTLTTRMAAGRVVVEVGDTGSGMAPEVVARLFTPFFTTKPVGVGTGLGLSICQRIVGGAGGSIEVDSTPGKGSVFRVLLPATDLPASTAPSGAMPELPLPVNRGRILVIDDDALVVRLIHRILATDHDVTTVTSAQAALDLIGAGERFDVLLCDVMMPQLTGMDLYARLVAKAPQQAERMVFVTGGAFTPMARDFLAQVQDHHIIEKPFDPLGLRKLVNARVAARRDG